MIWRASWGPLWSNRAFLTASRAQNLNATWNPKRSVYTGETHPQVNGLDARLQKFHLATQSGSASKIKTSYEQFRSHLATSPHTRRDSRGLNEDYFIAAMDIMSKSSVKEEANTVFVMFADLTSLFGLQPQKVHRIAFMQAMLSRGWQAQARARLREQPSSPEEYALVMASFQRDGREEEVVDMLTEAIQRGTDPNEDMYRMLMECSVKSKKPALSQKVAGVMRQYLSREPARAAFTRNFWDAFFSTLPSLQASIEAAKTCQAIQSITSEGSEPTSQEIASSPSIAGGDISTTRQDTATSIKDDFDHQQTQKLLDTRGFGPALMFLEEKKINGVNIPTYTISLLASEASKSSELKLISTKLGVPLDVNVWASLIQNVSKLRGVPAALAVYEDAKESGATPLCTLAVPILKKLCEGRVRSSSDTRLQEAMRLYGELKDALPPTLGADPLLQTSLTVVYDILLRMLADTMDPTTTFPIAVSLMGDMVTHGASFDISTATTLIILLMRSSPSHDAAYEICTLFQEQYSDTLNAKGCEAVLGAFSQLSFPHQPFTPPSLFFMMLNNMQRLGFQLSKRAYTTILSHIAKTSAHSPNPERAVETVRQIHKRLLLDTSLTPDTPLLNSLMNAYNRVGSAVEAVRVWETLYIQGKHNNASLSIVLDTLSHAGALHQAAGVMAKLHKSGFQLDRNNWQSWLEVLCRADKFDDAVRLLCFDMRYVEPPMIPDQEHIGTILKYSWDSGKRREIQSRIRRYWPSVWSSLPEDMKA